LEDLGHQGLEVDQLDSVAILDSMVDSTQDSMGDSTMVLMVDSIKASMEDLSPIDSQALQDPKTVFHNF